MNIDELIDDLAKIDLKFIDEQEEINIDLQFESANSFIIDNSKNDASIVEEKVEIVL